MAQLNNNPRNESYTVACICPTGIEQAALVALLDETYSDVFSDRSCYTLGRIDGHNIVVAVLPGPGTCNAAVVATQLLNDFKAIRFGLLVTTGSGIPVEDEYDIRLGDVVVSKSGIFGAVVPFDQGRILSGGRFEQIGILNKPPAILAANVQKLQSQHFRSRSQISTYLEGMIRKYPYLEDDKYSYQGIENDILFEATYEHHSSNSCSNCDQSRIINREIRYDTSPMIHYGTIGSASRKIEDASTRDKLQEDFGIICSETEAAGLMDEMPCLVICGIRDYADSHKNKEWQPYAAAVAAAYAKELLSIMPAPPPPPELTLETQPLDKQAIYFETINISREQDRFLDALPYNKDTTYDSLFSETQDQQPPSTVAKQITD